MFGNKRGWLRIVEASIAIILIMSVLLIVFQNRKMATPTDLTENTKIILEEIAKNSSLRMETLSYNSSSLANSSENSGIISNLKVFVSSKLPSNLNYEIVICNPEQFCSLEPYPNTKNEVYSSERIISADVVFENYTPKKIKLYVWLS